MLHSEVPFWMVVFERNHRFYRLEPFGALSTVIRFQAITILINQFFSPVTVAARTVALSVSSSLNSFTSNFSTGLYRQSLRHGLPEKRRKCINLFRRLQDNFSWTGLYPAMSSGNWCHSETLAEKSAFRCRAIYKTGAHGDDCPISQLASDDSSKSYREYEKIWIGRSESYKSWFCLFPGESCYWEEQPGQHWR